MRVPLPLVENYRAFSANLFLLVGAGFRQIFGQAIKLAGWVDFEDNYKFQFIFPNKLVNLLSLELLGL